MVTVTNPCHPFSGQKVEFRKGPKTVSPDWIIARLPNGTHRLLRREWTSLAPADPYQLLASPPQLRFEALLEIAEWVEKLKAGRTLEKGGSGGSERRVKDG